MLDETQEAREHYEDTVARGGVSDREMDLAWCLFSIERTGDASTRPAKVVLPDLCAPIYIDLARNILRTPSNKSALVAALSDA